MAGLITTGNFAKAMWPGINAFFGLQYNEHAEQWPELFEKNTSSKAWEEDVMGSGFGLAQVKPQGQAIKFDSETQGFTKRYTHIVYALGFIVSWEEMINNLYEEVGKRRSQRLAFSMRQTKEWVAANVYNRAFSNTYPGGDGVSMCNASHPSAAGNQSNVPSVAADISEAAIEDMLIQIGTATNDKGHPIAILPMKLIVPWQLWFEANRILKSVLQNDTANNAINVLKATNALPQGIKVNNYLTDPDNYFIRTNVPHGAKLFQRVGMEFAEDNEFTTKNQAYSAMEYYSVGWSDWRTTYGNNPS